MIVHSSKVSTRDFSWNKFTKTFSTEISDLGPDFNFGKIYDDACDQGLTLVSHVTNKEIVFGISEIKDKEGDILCWNLIPAEKKYRNLYKMTIFND